MLLAILPMFLLSCTKNDETRIVILSTTDVHGHVFPWDYYADRPDDQHSLLKAASLVESVRREYRHTLLLDAGDWLQGNPFAEYFAKVDTVSPYPFLRAVELMNYDAVVIGNHEFNFGIGLLNKRISETDVPFLGANIRSYETGVAAYTPYIIKEMGGYKVAVIGLTTPGSAVWDRPRVEGRLTFGDGTVYAQKYVDEVRGLGAELIVILAHSGLEPRDSYTVDGVPSENFGRQIAEEVEGVHALILGHSHRVIEDTIIRTPLNPNGVAVTMAGRWASHVGFTEFILSRDEFGTAQIAFGANSAIPVYNENPHKRISDELKEYHEMVVEYVTEPVARTSSEWSASDGRLYDRPITDLIQVVQKKVTGAQLSAASVFIPDASFGPGDITRGDLARLYPYENTLFKLRISGAQLREYLEFSARYYAQTPIGQTPEPAGVTPGFNFDVISGVDYVMDLSRPVGSRITKLTYDGRDVQASDSFTIAINSYRAVGGGDYDMIAGAEIITEIDQSVRSMIEEFLMEKETIEPEDVSVVNWRIEGLR